MAHGFRIRWLLKWTGTLVCVLILLTAAACLRWSYFCVHCPHIDRTDRLVVIGGGAVTVAWADDSIFLSDIPNVGPVFSSLQEEADVWRRHALWPCLQTGSYPVVSFVIVPFWIPFVLLAAPTAILWHRDRGRVASGCCRACGYNLTGNVSGRCPECGKPVEPA